jgi:hypothetical protein
MGEASFPQKQSAVVRITALDAEHYRVAWCTVGYPKFILDTERWQALSEVEGGKTKYETVEVFRGLLAYVVKFLLESSIRKGFHAIADSLKTVVSTDSK